VLPFANFYEKNINHFVSDFSCCLCTNRSERYPVFKNCTEKSGRELENCFITKLQKFVFENYKIPENLKKTSSKIWITWFLTLQKMAIS
jgi:hypothetical protein